MPTVTDKEGNEYEVVEHEHPSLSGLRYHALVPVPQREKKAVDPELKAFVRDCIRKFAWNIGVSHYHCDVEYMEKDKSHPGDDDCVTLAETRTDWRYLKADIRIYPALIEKWEKGLKEEVADTIAHEVAHLATSKLHFVALATYKNEDEVKDAFEELTTVVGRLAYNLHKEREENGERKTW